MNAGEDPAAHSGEEYRQELRKGLEQYQDQIQSLPWGAGSGFQGGASKAALRAAASHLRKYPRPGMVQEEIDRLVEAVEAPWGSRIEKQIREAMASAEGVAASAAIAETVRRLGLEPFRAPAPLPPIEEEDVRLICWWAVDSGE